MKDKEERFRLIAESKIREMIPAIAEQVASFLKGGPKQDQAFPREPSAVIHQNVCCDNCRAVHIQGIRYKCATCPDYDLC